MWVGYRARFRVLTAVLRSDDRGTDSRRILPTCPYPSVTGVRLSVMHPNSCRIIMAGFPQMLSLYQRLCETWSAGRPRAVRTLGNWCHNCGCETRAVGKHTLYRKRSRCMPAKGSHRPWRSDWSVPLLAERSSFALVHVETWAVGLMKCNHAPLDGDVDVRG